MDWAPFWMHLEGLIMVDENATQRKNKIGETREGGQGQAKHMPKPQITTRAAPNKQTQKH